MQTKIAIRVKTLYGKRKIFALDIDISESIDYLKEQLIKADTDYILSKYKQISLIHTIVSTDCLKIYRGR